MTTIRPYAAEDWPQVWPIFREVVRAADTFCYDPAMAEAAAQADWVAEPPSATVVAIDGADILGTARMGPNRSGPGAHVATASYMVAGHARGRGVGEALCRHSLDWARARGYAGMQFNAVAESNVTAVALYRRLGFTVIGTVPDAFAHPTLGRVGLHIMYRDFARD